MKIVVWLGVLILCQFLPGHYGLYLPCSSGEVYYNCEDFCKWGCRWKHHVCLAQCKRGCGCGRKVLIQTDGRECVQLQICTD